MAELKTPPYNTPITDQNDPTIFSRIWWLYLFRLLSVAGQPGPPGPPGSGAGYTLDVSLTADASITFGTTASDGQSLDVFVTNDNGGGWQITDWDAAVFASGTPTGVAQTDGSLTVFSFIGKPDLLYHIRCAPYLVG